MNHRQVSLEAGLWLVATPIGNARDITLRALDVLASADAIAAEDTRTARRLMEIHGIDPAGRPMIAYHDHSGEKTRSRISALVSEGKSVAYVSEAGTPLVSDPGFALARAVVADGGAVWPVPGASAVLAALTVAGLPSDRFLFAGFPPAAAGARRAAWEELRDVPATLVLYESPKRVAQTLAELAECFGPERPAALCRELTKRFEETRRGTLGSLKDSLEELPVKGECVILVDRGTGAAVTQEDLDEALLQAMQTMRLKDAATAVAGSFGVPRRDVYQRALALKDGDVEKR